MPIRIADNTRSDSLASALRRKRFAFFCSLLSKLKRPVHLLDVGGTAAFWEMMGIELLDGVLITLLNTSLAQSSSPQMLSVVGDARSLDYPDQSFDVVFSNSVIEHVGGQQDQAKMAAEIMRVAKRYFVQTPNRYFPLEPHFLMPFFQFWPLSLRAFMVQHFPLGWFEKTPDPDRARELVESIHLLSRADLLSIFPGCQLWAERVLGLTKSYVAYGGWEADGL